MSQQKPAQSALNYDFWQEMSENVDAVGTPGRGNLANLAGIYTQIDEEFEPFPFEYANRMTEQQKQQAYRNLPNHSSISYWGQRPYQPGNIEHLSGYASLDGQFFSDPWEEAVRQQQYRKWAQIEQKVAHANDSLNLWFR